MPRLHSAAVLVMCRRTIPGPLVFATHYLKRCAWNKKLEDISIYRLEGKLMPDSASAHEIEDKRSPVIYCHRYRASLLPHVP
ncbi:hypothetical protein HD806DRAFT_501798 [Xylariaceae sp. AK1471]|nr:hypothetical protein HD806DRAFT_501798 [Xylariaceae sp. AK1471]